MTQAHRKHTNAFKITIKIFGSEEQQWQPMVGNGRRLYGFLKEALLMGQALRILMVQLLLQSDHLEPLLQTAEELHAFCGDTARDWSEDDQLQQSEQLMIYIFQKMGITCVTTMVLATHECQK